MRLFKTVAGLRSYLQRQRLDKKIALVPTMGALHAGHLSLIERATSENEVVVVSIFVNPLQFGPSEDFKEYPRQLEVDCQHCDRLGVDVVFAPTPEEMGMSVDHSLNAPATTTVTPPQGMISVLCGRHREGHFQGVGTVVTKLLNIVQPHTAYFGEKDAQQLAIIRRLVADLFIPVEIKGCPTVREVTGLAYSSRNEYMNPEQRQQAVVLSHALYKAQQRFKAGENSASILIATVQEELASVAEIKPEYIELVHARTLEPLEEIQTAGLLAVAARINSVRLIDNIVLHRRQPIVAIDGPAGAGKSTVTRRVAEALGLLYLDTGAMYRAVTWLVLESGIATNDEAAIAELVSHAQIQLISEDTPNSSIRVQINGKDVTEAIRTSEVTAAVSAVSAQSAVRQALVRQQQQWGEKGGIVAEGRDIGTHVFPDAELKIFLTASVQERAYRRWQELKGLGEQLELEQLEEQIQKRDEFDSNRSVSPLRKAVNAIEVHTDDLSIEEVTASIIDLYHQQLSVVG